MDAPLPVPVPVLPEVEKKKPAVRGTQEQFTQVTEFLKQHRENINQQKLTISQAHQLVTTGMGITISPVTVRRACTFSGILLKHEQDVPEQHCDDELESRVGNLENQVHALQKAIETLTARIKMIQPGLFA